MVVIDYAKGTAMDDEINPMESTVDDETSTGHNNETAMENIDAVLENASPFRTTTATTTKNREKSNPGLPPLPNRRVPKTPTAVEPPATPLSLAESVSLVEPEEQDFEEIVRKRNRVSLFVLGKEKILNIFAASSRRHRRRPKLTRFVQKHSSLGPQRTRGLSHCPHQGANGPFGGRPSGRNETSGGCHDGSGRTWPNTGPRNGSQGSRTASSGKRNAPGAIGSIGKARLRIGRTLDPSRKTPVGGRRDQVFGADQIDCTNSGRTKHGTQGPTQTGGNPVAAGGRPRQGRTRKLESRAEWSDSKTKRTRDANYTKRGPVGPGAKAVRRQDRRRTRLASNRSRGGSHRATGSGRDNSECPESVHDTVAAQSFYSEFGLIVKRINHNHDANSVAH